MDLADIFLCNIMARSSCRQAEPVNIPRLEDGLDTTPFDLYQDPDKVTRTKWKRIFLQGEESNTLWPYIRWWRLGPALQMIHVPLPQYKKYVSEEKEKDPTETIQPLVEI